MRSISLRRHILLTALPLAIAALIVLAWLSWRDRQTANRPSFAHASELAGALGVNLRRDELAAPETPARLAAFVQGGVRWVRLELPWDQIEPTPGQFDWRETDQAFALLERHPDLRLLVTLNRSPAWARRPGDADNPLAPPQERRDFGRFAAAVASRYADRVDVYQIWHEPNIAPHWGARPIAPEDYVGLLREAALQIRAADPAAHIVLAALAPNVEPGGANMSDLIFLDALYRLGGRPWFDAVAAQPFGFSEPPAAPADPGMLNFARVALLREVMARHDDGEKRIWATAFGWNALPAGWMAQPSPWGQVSETQQARYAGQALTLAQTRWPWLGPLFWAAACPSMPADDPWQGFSLCAADGSLRPVWPALAEAAGAAPILPAGDHAVNHPAVRYSAGWRVVPAAADPSASGDHLTYTFWGSETALRVQGGPFWAYYRVTVDGQPANALPRDTSGAAYLVLYDPLAEERTVTLARALPAGRHEVTIEAQGGWGQWALRGIQIREATPSLPLSWPNWRALLLMAVVLAAAWCGLMGMPWLVRAGPGADADRQRAANGRLPSAVEAIVGRASLSWSGRPDAVWYGLAAILLLVCLFSQWLWLDLASLVGLGLLFLARGDVALPLIAFAIPLWPRPKVLAGLEFSLYELLIWLAVAAAGVRAFAPVFLAAWRFAGAPPGRVRIGRLRSLDWPMLAFLATGFVATLAAPRTDVALREFRTVFLLAALFYALVTRTRLPQGQRVSAWPLLYGLLAGMTFISLIALWQFVTGQGRIDVEGVGRVRAFYGSPNNLALVLDRVAPLGLALAAFGAWPARRSAERVVWWAATGIMALACVLTFSKGALLLGLPVGVATVLVGGAWRSRQRWPLWTLAGLAVVGGLGLLLLMRTPRFADLTNLDAGTGFFRLRLWQSAWNMLADHPWLGVGPDNFLYAYRTRYVLPDAWQELNLSHPHNIVLDLGTRLGLIGLIVGGWALGDSIRRGWRLFRLGDAMTWPPALGLLAGLLAALAHGLIDNSLFLIDLMALFALAAGMVEGMGKWANGQTGK